MKTGQNNRPPKTIGSILLALIRGSVIIQMLDKLTAKVYQAIANGFFGWLFTGYPMHARSGLAEAIGETRLWQRFGRMRRYINRMIEESLLCNLTEYLFKRFLRCRVRLFGVFGITFGAYTAAAALITSLSDNVSLYSHPKLLFALAVCFVSVVLVFSKSTLAQAICKSCVGHLILTVLGYTADDVRSAGSGEPVYRMHIPFILGLFCGILCDVALGRPTTVFTVTLTVVGLFFGYLGETVLSRRFPSYLICCLGALIVASCVQMFAPLFFDKVQFMPLLWTAAMQIVTSMICAVVLYPFIKWISRRSRR